MFSGIVTAVGRVAARELRDGDVRLVIEAPADFGLADAARGDSIAVSGVCLTAVALSARTFAADLSSETLARTTLGALEPGAAVNLELSLRYGDRVGGHLVAGHVDGIGRVLERRQDGRAERWRFALPAGLSRYLAPKGSIAVDGVSLTVNEVDDDGFGVALIPHTIAATCFRERRVGDAVNVEVDLLARYVERLLTARVTE